MKKKTTKVPAKKSPGAKVIHKNITRKIFKNEAALQRWIETLS